MTMQSSGPISIGQACAECGFSGQVDAADAQLVKLAGLPYAGAAQAWSMWYGKSSLPTIINTIVAQTSQHVDRHNIVNINLRTGAWSLLAATGDHGPGVNYMNVFPIANLGAYKSWNCSLQSLAGDARISVFIRQQPSPGNDFTVQLYFDDENGQTGEGNLPGNLQSNGANQNGDTNRAVSLLLTCTA